MTDAGYSPSDLDELESLAGASNLGTVLRALAELRAARVAHDELTRLRDDLDADDRFAAAAYRLGNILREWETG